MVVSDDLARLLLATIFAHSIDLKSVAGGGIVVLAANLLLQVVHFGREEFHRTAALRTHHVMVAAPVVLMFKAGNAVVEGDFAGQSTLRQQLQRAVYRGETDAGIFLLHQAVQLIGGKVVASLEKALQDGVALRGMFEAHPFQMLMQDLLRLADHLARDAGLVVNALL